MADDSPERLLRLADAMNTYNAAFAVIRDKGYHIYLVPDERPDFLGDFWAIKGGRDFIASDPLRLAGLIAIWEHFGDDWQDNVAEDIYEEVMNIAFHKDDYSTLGDGEFERLREHLAILFDALWLPPPGQVSRKELARRVETIPADLERLGSGDHEDDCGNR